MCSFKKTLPYVHLDSAEDFAVMRERAQKLVTENMVAWPRPDNPNTIDSDCSDEGSKLSLLVLESPLVTLQNYIWSLQVHQIQ